MAKSIDAAACTAQAAFPHLLGHAASLGGKGLDKRPPSPDGASTAAESATQPEYIRTYRAVRRLSVACISVPEGGHLVPTAQVAKALARRGHRAHLVSIAGVAGKVAKGCADAGCSFVGLAEGVGLADSGSCEAADLSDRGMMVTMFQYYSDEMKGPLRDFLAAERPDMVVADFTTPCAWEVADELGIPVLLNVPGPLALFKDLSWTMMATMYVRLRRAVGRSEAELTMALFGKIDMLLKSRICLFHTFFGLEPAQRVPPNYIITGSTAPRSAGGSSETSDPAFNDWLAWVRAEGLKVVYVTMGSMQILLDFQVRALYEGLAEIPGCAVAWSLKSQQQAYLPNGGAGLPKKFHVQQWLPQGEALQLPEVALVITHCGFGGMNEAIAAGKPIVATPFRADQPVNAGIVKERGVAEVLHTKTLSKESVRDAVSRVMADESYARCAKELQASLGKTGGAEACVEAVERFAEQGCEELVAPPGARPALAPRTPGRAARPLALGLACLAVGLAAARLASRR
uniref:UDP-glycosyltransferases domain-containing protein n=1 Tax=Alexandrium catenella TaxID=2925 RepID=A0A7S1WJ71_ALECA|mmetsp:Transcript_66158/g.176229  ORF Transcript_66158/g.176229 Transcript_66158/m.176229 type:complete len:516 (+) Transcript_66158:109-1656(+)